MSAESDAIAAQAAKQAAVNAARAAMNAAFATMIGARADYANFVPVWNNKIDLWGSAFAAATNALAAANAPGHPATTSAGLLAISNLLQAAADAAFNVDVAFVELDLKKGVYLAAVTAYNATVTALVAAQATAGSGLAVIVPVVLENGDGPVIMAAPIYSPSVPTVKEGPEHNPPVLGQSYTPLQ